MFKIDNFHEFVEFQLEILHLLKIKDKNKSLSKKERKFYIHCIYLNAIGVDITSTTAVHELMEYMGWKYFDNVYVYRSLLKRRNWLSKDDSTELGYNVIPMFRNIDINNLNKTYNFVIACDEKISVQKKV